MRNVGIGVAAGLVAFMIGFEIGISIYMLEPSGLFLPSEVLAGAFPGLRAKLRELFTVASSFEAA